MFTQYYKEKTFLRKEWKVRNNKTVVRPILIYTTWQAPSSPGWCWKTYRWTYIEETICMINKYESSETQSMLWIGWSKDVMNETRI